jgi:hypothetical protein
MVAVAQVTVTCEIPGEVSWLYLPDLHPSSQILLQDRGQRYLAMN